MTQSPDLLKKKVNAMFRFLLVTLGVCMAGHLGSVQVCAHRGGSHLFPENTLGAMKRALELTHVDRMDMDICMTKDGHIVVMHDLTLQPRLHQIDGEFISEEHDFVISHLNYDQLDNVDAGHYNLALFEDALPDYSPLPGEKIPLLRNVIAQLEEISHGKLHYQIEMKSSITHLHHLPNRQQYIDNLHQILEEFNIANRTDIQSFDWPLLIDLHKCYPHLTLSFVCDLDKDCSQHEFGIYTREWTKHSATDHDNNPFKMMRNLGAKVWSASLECIKKSM